MSRREEHPSGANYGFLLSTNLDEVHFNALQWRAMQCIYFFIFFFIIYFMTEGRYHIKDKIYIYHSYPCCLSLLVLPQKQTQSTNVWEVQYSSYWAPWSLIVLCHFTSSVLTARHCRSVYLGSLHSIVVLCKQFLLLEANRWFRR